MSNKRWMRPAERAVEPPFFAVFRNCFQLSEPGVLRFTWSADERAQLFCDGERIADGPPRGTPQRWFTSTVELPLPPGRHVLTARLFAFGRNLTAYAQMSVAPGFFLEEESGLLSPDWEYQTCMGCSFSGSKTDWGSYAHLLTDEDFNWSALRGEGGVWRKPGFFEDRRALVPSELPPMRHEETNGFRRVGNTFLFDDYVCVYGDYEFSGAGEVRLRWAEPGCEPEALDDAFLNQSKPGDPWPVFSGSGDRFRLTGGQRVRWQDYWWHAGRTLEMTLYGNVKLESARFFRTGYPWKLRRTLSLPGDARLSRLLRHSWNTLQACTFETLMDCPYYEQLQYISDSRFDLLSLYELSGDIRLAENALRQFAEGQYSSGMFPCRYPTREHAQYHATPGELYQLHIPSFTSFYIQLLHDFARLRRNDALVCELLPVARRAADYLNSTLGEDQLLHAPGWNFIDWLDNWEAGIPPGCRYGEGCTLNLIHLLSLQQLADLEQCFGSARQAALRQEQAARLKQAIRHTYWIDERNCFAEDSARSYVSEHAQVFALLALNERAVIPVLRSGTLDECGIAFSFYYLEACRIHRLDDLFARRRERYFQAAETPGLRTMPELFPNDWWQRSDCHAWGAHFLYFQFTAGTILDPIPRATLPETQP